MNLFDLTTSEIISRALPAAPAKKSARNRVTKCEHGFAWETGNRACPWCKVPENESKDRSTRPTIRERHAKAELENAALRALERSNPRTFLELAEAMNAEMKRKISAAIAATVVRRLFREGKTTVQIARADGSIV